MLRTWKVAVAAVAVGTLSAGPVCAFGLRHGHVKRQAGAASFTTTSTVASVGSVVSFAPATISTTSFIPLGVSGTSLISSGNLANFVNVGPSNLSVGSLPVYTNLVPVSPGTAGIASSGCNSGADSGLVQAIQNLTQAVTANTEAIRALSQQLPRDPDAEPPDDFGGPPPKSPFGAPGSAAAAGISATSGARTSQPDYARYERSFDHYIGQGNVKRATEMLRRSEDRQKLHQESIDRMKNRLKDFTTIPKQ